MTDTCCRLLTPKRVWLAPITLGALLAFPGLRLEPFNPPAVASSLAFTVAETAAGTYQSEPLAVEATVVGASFEDEPNGEVWVRASEDGAAWGSWVELDVDADHGPDADVPEGGADRIVSDPVWVGDANFVQFRTEVPEPDLRAELVETAGRQLNVVERVKLFFSRIRLGHSDAALAQPDQPAIMPRSAWGGDQCVVPQEIDYVKRVEMLFVHHTGPVGSSSNGYAQAEVPRIIYGLCSYHTYTQGWHDIAYNFLIDRFGIVWEGRAGGIEQGVRGAHVAAFNAYSTGVALIGDHRNVGPSPEAQDALARLAAWKLDVHHVDPTSYVTVTARAGSSRFTEGQLVTFPAIAGHRDASVTSCPGNGAYPLLTALRPLVHSIGGPKIYGGWADRDPVPGLPTTSYQPATFSFRMTEPMDWSLVITDQAGSQLFSQQGSGTEGAVVWSAPTGLPVTDYTVAVSAVPTSGAAPPRSAHFTFQLGDYVPPFSDDEGSVHQDHINAIYALGITRGCDATLFCPYDQVSRWQMALFLMRTWVAAGRTPPDGSAQGFTDITSMPIEHQVAINQLRRLGITAGTSATNYGPTDRVTRGQMALFIIRLLGVAGVALPEGSSQGYTDIGHLTIEQQTAINQLRQLGISAAVGTYLPDVAVPRAQMATFLARALGTLGISS